MGIEGEACPRSNSALALGLTFPLRAVVCASLIDVTMRSRAADCEKPFRERSRVTTQRGTTLWSRIEPFSHDETGDRLVTSGLRVDNTMNTGKLLLKA